MNDLIAAGIEKFRVLRVIEERPVLICQVEMLEDSDDSSTEMTGAATEAIQLFKDLVELNVRMKKIPVSELQQIVQPGGPPHC